MALTIDSSGSPIKVTGTTAADAEIVAKTETSKFFIRFVYWYNATTAGDLLVLTDATGRDIIRMRAFSDNESQMWPIMNQYSGIRASDMDSGTLYIYIK